jgi:hypothetical protein
MDITISTFLVVFFLIPGFIFTRAYYASPFSRKYSKSNLYSEIAWIIIPSGIIHIIGLYLMYYLYDDCFSELKKAAKLTLESFRDHPNFSNDLHFHFIILYTISLWVFAFFLGLMINVTVRKTHLDKRLRIFSFDNEWYYYLSGEILDFKNSVGTSKDVGLVFVDALVRNGENTHLYSGICENFHLKEDGGLSSISLCNTQKKTSKESSYESIPSSLLIIPFDQIVNLNIRYFSVNVELLEKQKNVAKSKSQDYKESKITLLETFLLASTLLIVIIAAISYFSKPDKNEKEQVEDKKSLLSALALILSFLGLKFGFNLSYLKSFLWALGFAVIVSILLELFMSSDKDKSEKEN